MAETAAAQLHRILHLIPHLADLTLRRDRRLNDVRAVLREAAAIENRPIAVRASLIEHTLHALERYSRQQSERPIYHAHLSHHCRAQD